MFSDINISTNKKSLLLDVFDTVKKYNADKYVVGETYTILSNDKEVGIAELVAMKPFFFHQIRNTLSFRIVGKEAPYMGGTLNKMYNNGQPLSRDFKLVQLVFKFKKRNASVTKDLIDKLIEELNTQSIYGN